VREDSEDRATPSVQKPATSTDAELMDGGLLPAVRAHARVHCTTWPR
jgi:hypothetical protein